MSFFQSPLGVQLGKVVDNKDPDQTGKVRVNFTWDQDSIQSSWASVVQPMAGNGYGVYFLPEIGDTVLVGFINNSHDNPVVIGSLYIGQGKQADMYDADNYKKNIHTKGGNQIWFDDKPGEEQIQIVNTDNGNSITFDMKEKHILISSPENIILDAPRININGAAIWLKGGDILIDANASYTSQGGKERQAENAGKLNMDSENDMKIMSAGAALLSANTTTTVKSSEAVHIQAVTDLKLQGMNINGAADVGVVMKGNATAELSASGQTTVKGGMVMIN